MALDARLAGLFAAGHILPVLRIFRWSPPAVSLGLHQDEGEIDAARCRRDRIDIVRRPTGGRAILHDQELTYAVIMPADGGVMDIYNRISLALVHGLRLYGAPVEVSRVQPAHLGAAGTPSSIPCFTSTGKYEIVWRGRKLVGSAQRQYRDEGVVLQHGSILTGPAHRRLTDYLVTDGETRARLAEEMRLRTTDLEEILGLPVRLADLAACLCRGFEAEWGVRFRTIDLPELEEPTHAATAQA
jgi:lipoyl(octanoyl) transferase